MRPQTSVGQLLENDADVLPLVVGGNEDRDLAAEVLGVAVAAEALPREPFEHGLELARHARALRERPHDQQEEDQDREDRDADDPRAVLALEREGGENRVEELRAGDERQASASASRMRMSPLRRMRRREIAKAATQNGQDEAADAQGGQLVGEKRGYGRGCQGRGRIDAGEDPFRGQPQPSLPFPRCAS